MFRVSMYRCWGPVQMLRGVRVYVGVQFPSEARQGVCGACVQVSKYGHALERSVGVSHLGDAEGLWGCEHRLGRAEVGEHRLWAGVRA